MTVFSRKRLLFLLLSLTVVATYCLWQDLTGDKVSNQSRSLEGILSLSSPASASDDSHAYDQITRPWVEHLERARQLLSLSREELAMRTLKEVDSSSDGGEYDDKEMTTFGETRKKEEIKELEMDKNMTNIDTTELPNLTEITTDMLDKPESHTKAELEQVHEIGLSSNKTSISKRMGDYRPKINASKRNDTIVSALVTALTLSKNSEEGTLAQKIELADVSSTPPSSLKLKDYIRDVPPPANLPWNRKQLLVSSKDIYERHWVHQLQHFLQHSYDPTYPVTLVSTNQLFVESVINWLIHSLVVLDNPLKNILVLTMDEDVYGFLKNRSINTICVTTAGNVKIDRPKKMMQMVRVEAARLLVLRMLNHWGIDVINYDNDAIVLKNPQHLLDEFRHHDIIGSEGFMPYDLHERWGVTLCFGFFLLRATPSTSE